MSERVSNCVRLFVHRFGARGAWGNGALPLISVAMSCQDAILEAGASHGGASLFAQPAICGLSEVLLERMCDSRIPGWWLQAASQRANHGRQKGRGRLDLSLDVHFVGVGIAHGSARAV